MSKSTSKARYMQLMEWLPTFSKPKKRNKDGKFVQKSRLNSYKEKGVR